MLAALGVYAGVVCLYLLCLDAATRSARSRPALRRVLCTIVGARWRGDQDVVLQNGLFGCGTAALSMLYRRLGKDECRVDIESRLPSFMPVTMLDMCRALRETGLEATGYEFVGAGDLTAFLEQRPRNEALLLLRQYGAGSVVSNALLLPFVILIRIFRMLGVSERPMLHWVLLDRTGADFDVLDPFLGRVRWNAKRFSKNWTGFAIVVVNPTEGDDRRLSHAVD